MMKIVKHTLFALLLACGTWTVQSEAMEESLQSSTTTNNNSSSYSTESDQGEKILEAQKKVVATYILTVRGGQVKLLCKKTSGKNENEGLTPATFKDKEEQNEKLGCKIIPITGLGITYAEGESKEYNLTFMFMQDQIPAPAEGAYEFANLNTLRSESSKVFQMQLFWNEGSFKQFEHDLRNCWKKISWQLKAEPEDHYFVFSLKPNEKDPNQPARVMQLQERLYKDSSLYAPVPFGRVRDALEKNGYAQFATTTCDQEHIAGIAVPFSTTLPEGYGWKPCTISDQVHAKQAKKAARPMQINYNDDLYLIYLALDTEIKELNKNNQGKEKEKEILEAIKNKSSIFQTEEEYEQEEKLEQLQAEIDPKLTASCINFDDNKIAAPAVFFHVTGEGMEVLVKGADLNNNGLSRNNPVLEDKDGAVSTLFAEKEPVGPTEDNKLEEKAYKIYNVYSAEEPKGFCWRPIDETENNTEGYHFLIKEAFKKLELSNNEGIQKFYEQLFDQKKAFDEKNQGKARYVFLTTDENGNLFVLVNKQRSPFLPEDAVKANEGTIEYTELGSKVLLRLGSGALSVLTNYGRENGGELLSLIKDGNKQLDDTNADILIALTRAGISLETLRQASEIKKLCDIKKILALKKQQSQIELKIQEKKPDEAKLKEAVEIKKRENEEKKKKLEELKKLTCTPVFYADEQNKLFVLVDQNKNPYFLKKATKKPSEISDLLKTLKYSWLLRADAKGNALPDNANKTANCRALIATQQLTPQNYQWISADGLKEVLTTVDLDEMAKKAFERRQNARNRLESENLKRESENLKRENEKIKIEKENENLENKKEIEKLDIENLKLENKKIEENFEKIEIEQLENKKEHLENKKELEKIKIENKKENEKLDIENEKNEHLEKSLLWWHPVQDLLFNSVIGFVVAAAKDYVKPTGLKNHMALLIPTSFAIRRAPNLKQRTMHTLACLGSYLGGNYLYKGLNWAGKQLYNTLT